LASGLGHALVVHDELANVAAEALCGCEMDGVERSELLRPQHSCSGKNVVVHTHQIASGQDGTAGVHCLVTARL
jgi:hypothetical protein